MFHYAHKLARWLISRKGSLHDERTSPESKGNLTFNDATQ